MCTLLLVDDEPNVLAALSRMLRPCKYHILKASSAMDALDLLASNEVGVVVSDQCMRDMTGIEFLTQVKERYPFTVRIMIGGDVSLQTISNAIKLGIVHAFVERPLDQLELSTILANAFDRYKTPNGES